MTAKPPDADMPAATPSRTVLAPLSWSDLLHAAVLLVALAAWAVTAKSASDQASHDLMRLDASVSDKIADLRSAMTSGLNDVRQQISVLPDQRARIDEMARQIADIDGRLGAMNQTVIAQDKALAEHQADLNVLMRTINSPLGRTAR